MHKITTTIERKYLREIIAGTKKIEYRDIKDYWARRLGGIECPFHLRLINGMSKSAPEVTVIVTKIRPNRRSGQYELHLGKIVSTKHWDRRRECPQSPR